MSRWGLAWRQGPRRPLPTGLCESEGCDRKATRLVQRPDPQQGTKRVCTDCSDELEAMGWRVLVYL